jgi:hypothetical protein
VEKDAETILLLSKLMERLAAIRCDCEHAVYGHILKERVLNVVDVMGLLIETIMGRKPTILSSEELAASHMPQPTIPAVNGPAVGGVTSAESPSAGLATMFRQAFPQKPIGS